MPFTGDYSYESHEMGMLPFRVKILGAKVMYFGENAKCFEKKSGELHSWPPQLFPIYFYDSVNFYKEK